MSDGHYPLPLPDINPELPPEMKTKMELVFYKRDVIVAGWSVRGQWRLHTDNVTPEEDAKHDIEVWSNPQFQQQYSGVMTILPISTFRRWEPVFREFIFYNRVGGQIPFHDDAHYFRGNFNVTEEKDMLGKFVQINFFGKMSTKDWKEVKRIVDMRLKSYGGRWEWSGRDLRILATAANLDRKKPKLKHDEIAGLLAADENLPANGYTADDVGEILKQAHRLGF